MRKFISFILSIVLVFSMAVPVFASEVKADIDQIDASIWNNTYVYDEYTLQDVLTETERILISNDGLNETVFRENLATGTATKTVNGQVVATYDMDTRRAEKITTWEIPAEDLTLINDYFEQNKSTASFSSTLPEELVGRYEIVLTDGGILIHPTDSITARATARSSTNVYAYSSVTSAYPPYTSKIMKSSSVYSDYCQRSLSVQARDSMNQYARVRSESAFYTAGTAVIDIVADLMINPDKVQSVLNAYGVLLSASQTISTNITFYKSEEYNFYATREAHIYDYTNYNRYVCVKAEAGTGKLSVGWDLVGGYCVNPGWYITGIPYPWTAYTHDSIINAAVDIWEYNMQEYGYWLE